MKKVDVCIKVENIPSEVLGILGRGVPELCTKLLLRNYPKLRTVFLL